MALIRSTKLSLSKLPSVEEFHVLTAFVVDPQQLQCGESTLLSCTHNAAVKSEWELLSIHLDGESLVGLL